MKLRIKKIIFKNDVRFKESTYYFFDTKPLIYVETYDGFKGVMPIDNDLLGMVDRTPGIHKKIIYYKNTGFELKYTTHGNVAFVYNSLGRNSFYPYEDLRDIYENGRIFVIYDDGYTETYDLRQCSFGYDPANVTPEVHTGYISSILDNFKFYYRIKAPTKVELIKNGDSIFYEGDLDSTYDLILHCTYDTGIEYDVKVDSSMISNFSLNEAGNHTATITFGSFQFKYDYTVISNKIVSGTVSEAMNAHRMYTTDPICFDVVFTRENGKKSTLTIYDYEITGFDYTPGSHSVVSCHNGVELRFDYEIDDPTPLSVKLNTIYYVGVSNNRRLVLDVVYDGGYKTKHTVYLDELIDLSKLDLSAGAHTITLKYKGIDFEYTYEI